MLINEDAKGSIFKIDKQMLNKNEIDKQMVKKSKW